MLKAKRAVLCGLAAVALSACASTSKPIAGSIKPAGTSTTSQDAPGFHGRVLDPRLKHATCLHDNGIAFTEPGPQSIQIGATGVGPYVYFYATPGIAQGQQISDREQGAEVIGSALLYPNDATGTQLSTIETCMAQGVNG